MPVFQQRRGTAAALAAANEMPAAGQIYFETDTNRVKVGDGIRRYNSLQYLVTPTSVSDVVGLQAALEGKQAAGSYAAAVHDHTAAQVSGLAAVATTGAYGDLSGRPTIPAAYTLPVATTAVLGGVKAGSNVTISGTGVISVAAPVTTLPYGSITGTPSLATVATTGAYSDLTGRPTIPAAYTLPTASGSTLGGVRIGAGISIDGSGVISASSAYSLPTASASILGGVKVGSGISIDGNGVISASSSYTLPNATTSTLGGVIVGTGLSVSSGTVSVSYGSSSGTACQGNDARLNEEVVEYATTDLFPATGVSSILYVATDTSRAYRWTGAVYVEVGSASLGFVTSVAGKVGDITLDHRDIGNLPATLAQFTADQNNLSLGTGGIIRISSDAARNITGFAGGQSGDARLLVNVGSFAITLKHQSTSSNETNRIIGVSSADVSIPSQGSVVIYYDGTDSRWRAG